MAANTDAKSPITIRLKDSVIEGTDQALRSQLGSARGKSVIIDGSNVIRVNSIGMRDLTRLMQETARHNKIIYARCSPIFTDFMNLVQAAAKCATFESFLINYYCAKCQTTSTIETSATSFKNTDEFAEHVCKTCSQKLAPEGDFEVYQALIDQSTLEK